MGDKDREDDTSLFRTAMRDVRPLKDSGQIISSGRRVAKRARRMRSERTALLRNSAQTPSPTANQADGTDLYELQAGDELKFRRAGVSEAALRRLRRGQLRVEAEIDLHGSTLAQALPMLQSFLLEARGRGLQCVRIIHGKGLRSGNRGPVLKNWVNAQLRRTEGVLAFASARPPAGGTGATWVLLART